MKALASVLASLTGGLLLGVLLSASRAPAGLGIAWLPAASATDASLFRAGALAAAALSALGARRFERPPVVGLLCGALAGYALHGLALFHVLAIDGWLVELVALLLVPAALRLHWAGRADERGPPPPARLAGLVLAGAGAALALESLARPLRLLGRGLPGDDTAFGLTLLAATALGAAAFGPLLARPRAAALALPLLLAAAAGTAREGLGFVAGMGDPARFEGYVRGFGLDTTEWGTLRSDLLLAARTFVLPGFALGAALACARHRRELAAALAGGALGALALPFLVGATIASETAAIASAPGERIAFACALAVAGALVALIAPATPGPRGSGFRAPGARTIRDATASPLARGAVAVVALALACAVWIAPRPAALAYRPWELVSMDPGLVRETREGILTSGFRPHEGPRFALDGRALTPGRDEVEDDALALVAAPLGQGGATDGSNGSPDGSSGRGTGRVLFIGQLTLERALALTSIGAQVIDRTAPWHAVMADYEETQFTGHLRPAGAVLSPARALSDLGGYDLVVAPAVEGYAPATRAVLRADNALAWLRADTPISGRAWGSGVLLAGADFKDLAVGIGPAAARSPAAFAPGPRRAPPSPLRELASPRAVSDWEHLAATAARLAAGASGGTGAASGPDAKLARALELLAAAQRRSASWDDDAQATELDPEALALLREAILTRGAPLPLERSLATYLARVCVGKRRVEWLYTYFEPLAVAAAPWPELERALLAADVESLDFESATARLDTLLAVRPGDADLLQWRAAARIQLGLPAAAASDLRAALEARPGRRDLERELAMALVRAGDPEGADWAAELLRAEPDDAQLAPYLDAARGAAPMPPLPPPPSLQGGMPAL